MEWANSRCAKCGARLGWHLGMSAASTTLRYFCMTCAPLPLPEIPSANSAAPEDRP
jgi:hypothetical protein